MKKINKLVLEGDAAAAVLRAAQDLELSPVRLLVDCVNHGLHAALQARGTATLNYQPVASTEAAAPAPAPVSAPKTFTVDAPDAPPKRRGRPRANNVSVSPVSPRIPKVSTGKRGRPRKTTLTVDSPAAVSDSGQKRRGRPPGARNKNPKSARVEVTAAVSNGSDVTEV